MKLKTLLLTLSLILAGFTHSAFDFYGVDLGKLRVIEDSQDKDYNEGQYKVNQNIKLTPIGSGGIFNIPPRVITNPFWKNTNTTKHLNRPSAVTKGAIVESLDVDTMSMGPAGRNDDRAGTSMASPEQPKSESVKLKFIDGEWVEIRVIDTALDEIVEIEPLDGGTTAVSATCGPGINLCVFPGDTCSYSDPPNVYACFCNGAFWNCTKQK
ncbi:MAG: hypothetical protein NZ735_08205 [Candidatus Marinimicrobia bacterium]|nr:hypothetical protein [Candidatus Neomarinimicrobiota bacterium]